MLCVCGYGATRIAGRVGTSEIMAFAAFERLWGVCPMLWRCLCRILDIILRSLLDTYNKSTLEN